MIGPSSYSGAGLMNRVFVLSVLFMTTLGVPVEAAVVAHDWKTPGDGLLTYDTVNKREWLDFTQSRLSMFLGASLEQRFQNALPELAAGGKFAGFSIGKSNDVIALGASAGINTSIGDFAINEMPTRALISLVDSNPVLTASGGVNALGALDEIRTAQMPPAGLRLLANLNVIPTSGAAGFAGLDPFGYYEPFEFPSVGLWLYRTAVPEPRTATLVATLAIAIITLASWQRRSPRLRLLGRETNSDLNFEILEDRRVLATGVAADIVFLIDESGSNSVSDPTHDWVRTSLVPRLEATGFASNLASKGITDVKYGLVGYGGGSNISPNRDLANSFVVNSASSTSKLVGTNLQLSQAMANLSRNGDFEDGWDAIEHAMAEYPFRAGAVPVLVLVQSDEGRNELNATLTRPGVLAALQSKNVLLDSLVVGADVNGEGFDPVDLFDLRLMDLARMFAFSA
jgi:hypothetical protein